MARDRTVRVMLPRPSRAPGMAPVLLSLIAVAVVAANLRPVATSVGPVLSEITHDLGMAASTAGVLTALPGLAFAVAGGVAVALARRLALNAAITGSILVLCGALAARSLVDSASAFLLLSALALAGAGIGNVLVPAFIKRHFASRQASATAVYTVCLAIGATTAAVVAAPLAAAVSGGWRASLGAWGIVGALAAVPWVALTILERRHRAHLPPPDRTRIRVASSRRAVALAAFFGLQSAQAYVQFGWIAQIYRDGGLSPAAAGAMGGVIAALGIPAGLLMPGVVGRVRDLRPVAALLGALLSVGYLGILWAPTTLPWLWALCLGLSGFAFPAAIALITARTRAPIVTAHVSGFTQSWGYLVAAAGPFAVGALHDLTGGWRVPLLALAACGPLLAVLGMAAGAQGYVDDDLAHA